MITRFAKHRLGSRQRRFCHVGRIIRLAGIICLITLSIAWAGPICNSCGYESADNAIFCSHCGQKLGTTAPAISEPEAEKPQPTTPEEPPTIAPKFVAKDMRQAKASLNDNKVELAGMLARNAMALNLLAGSDPDNKRAKAIMAFIEECDRKEGIVRRKCPICHGSGKAIMTVNSLNGTRSKMKVNGQPCARCQGTGIIRGKGTVNERKYRIAKAKRKYTTLQQSHHRVQVGEVWVPEKVVDKLSLTETAKLKTAIPPPCERCMGIGREDCSSCNGTGRKTCSAKGCKNGRIDLDAKSGLIGASMNQTVACTRCGGSGYEQCPKCSGSGNFICRACNGEGVGELCKKCGGTGTTTCRRCSGSGTYKGQKCPTCGGAGITECTSCNGMGRKR